MAKTSLADYKSEGHNWIALSSGEFYPDILVDAVALYEPVLVLFKQVLLTSESSERLLLQSADVPQPWMRVQLCRVFRKYVSPGTPVEMLKRKSKAHSIIAHFHRQFRPIQEVQVAFLSRPLPDEALCAVLWEYNNRGQKGYDLTERFFELLQARFSELSIRGPQRAGKDIRLGSVLASYPNHNRPVDFVISDGEQVVAIGLARYDSDQGGAQEDDRTGGYSNCADEILTYAQETSQNIKVIFVNDGPDLLLGSMWDDYASLESRWPGKIMVLTLRMTPDRLTLAWLKA